MRRVVAIDDTAELTVEEAADGHGLVVTLSRLSGAATTETVRGVFLQGRLKDAIVPRQRSARKKDD